ncbi:MAG TPA: aminopeptidase P family protein [Dysgonamonadaceae bacterium]|jgi:Xaa-Pro aminopeptidase|nr:aminopeptidase P family protein [Dysgonamonadaceae bacterium]
MTEKPNQISERLSALRKFMKTRHLDAFIVPSTDPHLSEYPPKRWECRKWITGFTGSAGTAVITMKQAGVWTDSRYFLQAAQQLEGTGFDLFKMGMPETPDMIDWIVEQVGNGGKVGIDGMVYATSEAKTLKNKLESKGIALETRFNPFEEIWKDRPEIPQNKIFTLPEEITGESTKNKIERIVEEIEKAGAEGIVIATLDAVAWTFNIRGNDVEYNPVAVAYGYVSKNESVLFIDPDKLTPPIASELQSQGVKTANYNHIFDYIEELPEKTTICVTESKINYTLYQHLSARCKVIDLPSPIDLMKSMKNETELNGFRRAMVKDGVALTRFYMWLEKAVPTGTVTEMTIAEKLREFRSQQEQYMGESFGTIAGYAAHGAIVHYSATPESNSIIEPRGLLLIDSGAQFMHGTTDITRTVALGEIAPQMKSDYTKVLKGHIALATAIYPEGTRGSQLDILAHKPLWDDCETYWHGTGHGIGHFLNVHEGPQNIRTEENPIPLKQGMVTSNEPGIYRTDQYGIRIENLVVTQEYKKTEDFGTFYHFETLTLCPIDTKPIETDMLTEKEKLWLNNYHRMVYDKLQHHLNEEEKAWLKEKTKAI